MSNIEAARLLLKFLAVKGKLCLPDKSKIAHEILAYLAAHPDAQDTLDGIVRWWMLERKIIYQQELVREALNELVSRDLLIMEKGKYSKNIYRLNKPNV